GRSATGTARPPRSARAVSTAQVSAAEEDSPAPAGTSESITSRAPGGAYPASRIAHTTPATYPAQPPGGGRPSRVNDRSAPVWAAAEDCPGPAGRAESIPRRAPGGAYPASRIAHTSPATYPAQPPGGGRSSSVNDRSSPVWADQTVHSAASCGAAAT